LTALATDGGSAPAVSGCEPRLIREDEMSARDGWLAKIENATTEAIARRVWKHGSCTKHRCRTLVGRNRPALSPDYQPTARVERTPSLSLSVPGQGVKRQPRWVVALGADSRPMRRGVPVWRLGDGLLPRMRPTAG
jgi:hypothetical protein